MTTYTLYRDDLETIEPDEAETQEKIIQLMTEGMHLVRKESGTGENVRISHAKAFGLLEGKLIVKQNPEAELAQGLFAEPGEYRVLVRLANAPGEINDDSKVRTARGMAIKIFGVPGPKLPGHNVDTQDFVLNAGKEFFNSDVKGFLQTFKPNAKIAPMLSDTVKGTVSDIARATNSGLNAIGLNSEKLDFFGPKDQHPMAAAYYSQTPYRFGDYVAKIGAIPDMGALQSLIDRPYIPATQDALREAANEYFRSQAAEFVIAVQLNVDPEKMPIEDAQAKWSEELSPYRPVARLVLPAQTAFDADKNAYFENLSFSPAHALAAHRPLGSVNRARLAVYRALARRRRVENGKPDEELD